jgi:ribosomal-protein-alanine N-acetyltransferase
LSDVWHVSPAEPKEAEAYAVVLAAGGASSWDARMVAEEFAHPDARIWCVRDAVLRGVIFARLIDGALHVFNLAVQAESRRQGVARALLAQAVEVAAQQGRGELLLEVGADNAAALGFYEAVGFVVVGMRPRYYPGGEDAVLMTFTS